MGTRASWATCTNAALSSSSIWIMKMPHQMDRARLLPIFDRHSRISRSEYDAGWRRHDDGTTCPRLRIFCSEHHRDMKNRHDYPRPIELRPRCRKAHGVASQDEAAANDRPEQ